MPTWYSRVEALAALGVRPQTLYAYASRGRIAVAPDPADPRRSLYRREDIDELLRRRQRGRRPAAIAASTIAWGEPIIATAISTVAAGRLRYRGRDAVALSGTATLEEVAGLLWEEATPPRLESRTAASPAGRPSFRLALEALTALAAESYPVLGRTPAALRAEAPRLVGTLAAAFGTPGGKGPLHRRLGAAWALDAAASDLVRRALVLLADQELTTSAFTARIVASTGAPLASCLVAGLAALSGPLHGGAPSRVRTLFEEVDRLGPKGTVGRYLGAGVPLPGFGHALYPEGDPRAKALLGAFAAPEAFTAMIAEVGAETGLLPTVDVALEALRARHRLPPDASFTLFALARSVGMIAHAIEQTQSPGLIRPRARYVGPDEAPS